MTDPKPDVAGARERLLADLREVETTSRTIYRGDFINRDGRRAHDEIQRQGEEIERLRGALTLAANRLDRLSLETPPAGRLRAESVEWIAEAREATRAREGGENETL